MHLFNRIKFSTPESVELEFTLAGIGSRTWALIIDYNILGLSLALFIFLWVTISAQLIDTGLEIFGTGFGLWMTAIGLLSLFFIYTGYFVFFETIWQGQTPGKRIAKIRVVRDDGRPLSLQQAALRALLRPIDETLFIGACLIMFGKSEKRLGDLVAGTIVIQTQTVNKSAHLIISAEAKSFYISLQKISDLSQLLPDDFAIIREYLLRRNGMSHKARTSLSLKLSQQVQSIINLTIMPADISSDVFLEAVYLAYQQPEFE
ncbi:RDD family protein [Sphaerospermopsis aphanizomenoides BCCUSP55]|uniref:RDD family protein n=1 Tax=Sphaerospermopsis aphanizomenoides TaxID=459663 RepID=UPI0019044812|nr:RDD family protein [Sphaerospermopsis aphanizomenoides]MBK1987728.1 RDD family protein [Sphaerospermopsis aphanizomenoides BCCUSP55]